MSPISRTWRQVREIGDITANHRQRSEEHTSELQSRLHLVCRLLLEKKKKTRVRSCNISPALMTAMRVCSVIASLWPYFTYTIFAYSRMVYSLFWHLIFTRSVMTMI